MHAQDGFDGKQDDSDIFLLQRPAYGNSTVDRIVPLHKHMLMSSCAPRIFPSKQPLAEEV
jgi:hypothetical protein